MLRIEKMRGSRGWIYVLVVRVPVWCRKYARREKKQKPVAVESKEA